MTTPQSAQPRRIVDAVRGFLAVVVLAALVVGLPAALWALSQALRPARGLDLSRVVSALTRPDDGSLFLLALLLVGWCAWAVFTLSVAVEVVAFARRVPTPRLPLLTLPQQGAAVLVATAALLVTPAGGSVSSPPVARPVAAASVFETSEPRPAVPVIVQTHEGQQPTTPRADRHTAAASVPYPTVTVRRHDTLWSLAQSHLGSGERFGEIVALNLGRRQVDGRALTDANWIYPGWVLRLPPDARQASASGVDEPAAADRAPETYTVEHGDSLWEIAEDSLGAGQRFGEIYHLNDGRPQQDGLRLTDPDEIRPGWQLRLPATAAPPTVARVGGPPGGDRAASAGSGETPTSPLPAPGALSASADPRPTSQPTSTVPSASADEHDTFAAPALVLGLGTLVLTGLVGDLALRRRRQQRTRAAGRRIAMPPPETAAVEQLARAASDPVTVDSLQVALRALVASCRLAGRALPDVVLARITSSAVDLLLRDDDPVAVEPFRPVGPRTWRLNTMPQPDDDVTMPFPALVTLGVDGDALVLLNLEAIGSLVLVGHVADTEPVMRALATELAVGPFAGGTTLTFVGRFAELARVVGPARGRFQASSSAAAREAAVRVEAIRDVLQRSGAADLREARVRGIASDAAIPEILIAADEMPHPPPPWSGVAAVMIAEGAAPNDGWTLQVKPDGSAHLGPLAVEVSPQRLAQDDYDHLVSLLASADNLSGHARVDKLPTDGAARPDLSHDRVQALKALPLPDDGAQHAVVASPRAPRLLLLGNVNVEGADDDAAPGRRRRATELVAYLALHPGVSSHEIDEAMWPGRRVAKNTRNPFISRVRQWLGRTPDGDPYLPLVADGGKYRLRPEVNSDWHDFVHLARRGLSRGLDGVDDLADALDLVRGRPFLGIDPATYTWAEADIQEMISAIVDVAHVLSASRCEVGDHRGAQESAAKGLLVESCSELLYRDAIRAAAARGDRREVERLAERLREELALVDPDDGIADDTADLLSVVQQ